PGGSSSCGSPGLCAGSGSGLVAGDEAAGVLWPAGAFCEAAAFWPAGVLFLLAPVSDCVGGVPLWASACDIVNSKMRTRGTGLFTQTTPGPGSHSARCGDPSGRPRRRSALD